MSVHTGIRGIRDTIPPGVVLGRMPGTSGPAQTIDIATLGRAVAATLPSGTGFGMIGNNLVVGNISGAANTPVGVTLTALIDATLGSTQGQIIYRNGTVWTVLAPGTSGKFLQTLGGAANPAWASAGDVVGPGSSTDGHVVFFNGATGKLIKDSGLTLSGTNTGDQTNITGNAGTATLAAAVTAAWASFTASRTGWTDVGSPTVTARKNQVGNIAYFQVKVAPGTTCATVAGTSYIALPITAAGIGGSATMYDLTTNISVGNCAIDVTNSRVYVPSQVATADTLVIAGWYEC